MKAAVCTNYGPPEVVEIREVEKPVPGRKDILVRVSATTVTSGDARLRGSNVPQGFKLITRLFFGWNRPRKPILGVELAGEVEETGADVKLFRKGDQVFGSGDMRMACHAEYVAVPEDGPVVMKPPGMSNEEAAAIPFGALSSLVYLRDFGKIRSGQSVLVNGASGALGTYAVQLAKHFGAEVTGVCSTANVELVRSLRADRILDYTKDDLFPEAEMYDIIFDTVGKISFSQCKAALKPKGRFLMGVAGMPQFLLVLWTGLTGGKRAMAGIANFTKEDLSFVAQLLEAGIVRPVIDRQYPLEQITEAHRLVDTGRKKGAVVITVGPPRSS